MSQPNLGVGERSRKRKRGHPPHSQQFFDDHFFVLGKVMAPVNFIHLEKKIRDRTELEYVPSSDSSRLVWVEPRGKGRCRGCLDGT